MASSAFSFHCMICFEEFDPQTNYPVVLPCGHTYVCIECANRLDKCMECRTPLTMAMKVEPPPPPPPTPGSAPNAAASAGAAGGPGSPEVQQKENRQNAGSFNADRVRNSPGFRRRYGQRDDYRSTYADRYGKREPPTPTPPAPKQRLPLPKNAVLLSLIQASEPARRRAEVEAPPTPQKPDGKTLPPLGSETPSPGKRDAGILPKYSRPSPLFLDKSSSGEGEHAGSNLLPSAHPQNLSLSAASVDDEEHKIRVGTYLEGGPCGTYAVAVKGGLLVYPTLFEHALPDGLTGRDSDDDAVKRDVDELVKKHRASRMHAQKESPEWKERKTGVSVGSDVGVHFEDERMGGSGPASDVGKSSSLFPTDELGGGVSVGGVSVECHEEGDVEASCSLESPQDRLNGEGIVPLKGDEEKGPLDPTAKGETSSDPGKAPSDEENDGDDVGLTVSLTISDDEEADTMGGSMRVPARRSQTIIGASSQTSSASKDDHDPPANKTYLRHFSQGSVHDLAHKKKGKGKKKKGDGTDEFDRPLIRLKYGDRVQVVSMDSRGWVKLARGYGYIRLENDKQLVKVGGTSDKACQIEAMLHELSLERNRLKHEQLKLERLSAGLMIDLQSTLLTSDDHVVVPAPEGSLLRSESELSPGLVSVDDIDVSARSKTALTPPRDVQGKDGRSDRSQENGHRQIRSAKSHSPGRSGLASPTTVGATRSMAPPSPPYGQIASGTPTQGNWSNIHTPTRVNFRTGMSGHRALTSSHSHPHDFIDRGQSTFRSMSNHAGISSTKKSSSRGRSIY